MDDPRRTKQIAVLAWIAGAVDTLGYLSLGQVFVSHMTGNVGVFAIALAQHRFGDAFQHGIAVPLFFAGALIGGGLVGSADDRRQVARALAVEASLLVLFVLLHRGSGSGEAVGGGWFLMLLALTVATGIQNAALTHPGMRGTHTTHLTGPTTDAAIELVRYVSPRRRGEFDPSRLLRFAARPIAFAVGALCGAALHAVAPAAGPLVPAGILAWIVAADLV